MIWHCEIAYLIALFRADWGSYDPQPDKLAQIKVISAWPYFSFASIIRLQYM